MTAQLINDGTLPTGTEVSQLSDALLAAAFWDDDYDTDQRLSLVALLLPRTYADNSGVALDYYQQVALALDRARVHEIPLGDPENVPIWEGEATTSALNAAVNEIVAHGRKTP